MFFIVFQCHNMTLIGAKLKSVRLYKMTRKRFSFHLTPLGVDGHRINYRHKDHAVGLQLFNLTYTISDRNWGWPGMAPRKTMRSKFSKSSKMSKIYMFQGPQF